MVDSLYQRDNTYVPTCLHTSYIMRPKVHSWNLQVLHVMILVSRDDIQGNILGSCGNLTSINICYVVKILDLRYMCEEVGTAYLG